MVLVDFKDKQKLENKNKLHKIFEASESDLENKLQFINKSFQSSFSEGLDVFLQTYKEFSEYFEKNYDLDFFNPGLQADSINVLSNYYQSLPKHLKKIALTNVLNFLNDEPKGYVVFNFIDNSKLISDILLNDSNFFGSLVSTQYELVFAHINSVDSFKKFYQSDSETEFMDKNYDLDLEIIDNDFWLSYYIAYNGLVSTSIQTKFFSEILKDTDELCNSIASFVFLDLIEDVKKGYLEDSDIYSHIEKVILPDYHFSLGPKILEKFKEQNWTYLATDTLPQSLREELLIE